MALDRTELDLLAGTCLVGLSIVLAWLLTRFVDSPIRRSPWLEARWWRSATAIAVSCALVLGTVGTVRAVLDQRAAQTEELAAKNNPGARALEPGFVDRADSAADPIPDLSLLQEDWFALENRCSGTLEAPEPLRDVCFQEGDGTGEILVLLGDSRDEQFAPSIVQTALDNGWTVITLFQAGCPYAAGEGIYPDCDERNDVIEEYLLSIGPTAVMSAYSYIPVGLAEVPMFGYESRARALLEAGIDVIGTRDIPRLDGSPIDCVADFEADPSRCAFDISEQYAPEPPLPQLTGRNEPGRGAFYTLDATEQICPQDRCVPIIGNVYVWLDAAHITQTYAESLSTTTDQQLGAQGWTWAGR